MSVGALALCVLGADSPESGAQPLTNEDGSLVLAVNGELYNHRVLRKHLKTSYPFKTQSDCEIIIPLVLHRLDRSVTR